LQGHHHYRKQHAQATHKTMAHQFQMPPWRNLLLITALVFLISTIHHTTADISAQQLFDAVDSNHDHSISESELEEALSRLIDGSATASSGGGGAPPLGLDSNPFAYQRKQSQSEGSDGSKFDNPKKTKDFLKALFSSFSAIIATEIGDKTFFIAAVLSMRNDRIAVFGGAILALIVMTILRFVHCTLLCHCFVHQFSP
jgi:uncharacterized membrane protein